MIDAILLFLVTVQKPPTVPIQNAAQRAVPIEDGWVEHALARSERATKLLASAEEHRLQVLVSEVTADKDGKFVLTRHGYRVDREYFYPASAIKLLGAVAALEKLGQLKKKTPALSVTTPMVWWPLFKDEVKEDKDASNLDDGKITLRHEIRKLFLVSDNAAFNRLYEFVGPKEMNEWMWAAGLASTRVVHRLSSPRSESENLKTPRIDFALADKPVTIPERTSDLKVEATHAKNTKVGKAQMLDDKLIATPIDFARKNAISLVDLQNALIKVVRRDIDLGTKPFELADDDVALLLDAMSEYPAQSQNPRYPRDQYPDSFGKFLLPGLEKVAPKGAWKIYNKIGRAYGFSIENAYVVDTRSQRVFFVTATIYTNANGILNDGIYEYEEIADPFFEDIGECLAR
jgi:beta-lactamase class A